MTYTTANITTADKLSLTTHSWTVPMPKAKIIFVHGFFEHGFRYKREAEYFNQEGINFYTYDQRSHGLSDGKYRSYVDNFQHYVDDYELFLNSPPKSTVPTFLFAHSMGGLVLVSYLLYTSNKIDNKGIILSAPLLMPDKNTAPLLQKMSGIVGTLFPRLKTIKIDANAVSSDPKEVEKYTSDPLNYTDKMYASSGYHLLKQMKKVQGDMTKFEWPYLILHGTDDKLAEIEGSRLLHSLASSEDKQFVELKDYRHEITRDIGHEHVLETILNWINKRI